MNALSLSLRQALYAGLTLCLLLVATGCDSADPIATEADVVVMSQNVYLGGDIFLVAGEPNQQMIPVRVAEFYQMVQDTDFPARAEAIADEIVRQQPDLIGLQEVSTFYTQSPSDFMQGVREPNATDLQYDFLQILLDALAERGANYTAVSVAQNADVELPATDDGGQTFYDVRYQDSDVILAREGINVSDAFEKHFEALLTVEVGGVPQTFVRSYQRVSATVNGQPLTFFNTHLEVGSVAPIQAPQAQELKAAIDATPGTVILVGDLNSRADGTSTPTYALMLESMRDIFGGPEGGQPTCCQEDDLLNEESLLNRRIDFVLYRGEPTSVEGETVLNRQEDRVQGQGGLLWPVDHAGVVGRFTFAQ